MSKITFGWHMPSFPIDGSSGPQFRDQITSYLARVQDQYKSVWADDHVHPWAAFQPSDTAALECLTTLAYLAGMFPAIKLGSMVLCQSFRNPGLVAKMMANLQLMSGGRLICGIGAGWLEEEYSAYNYDYPKADVRLAQLEETVQILKLMWTEAPATFEGQHYKIKEAYCEPKPDPLPPLMIGGGGEKVTLRIVAKYADWWNLPGGTFELYNHKLSVLRRHCEAVGRNYDEIVKTWSPEEVAIAKDEAEARRILETSPYKSDLPLIGTPNQIVDILGPFVEAGVTQFFPRFVDFPNPAGAELFAETVIPQLS